MKTFGLYQSLAQRVILLIITGLISAQMISAQSWFDNTWPYRRAVAISNPSGSDQSDYQVSIQLDNLNFDFGNILSDGNDIRVTANDGSTLIPFWIEEWDQAGSQASLWARIPDLNVEGTIVYIYYGNPSPFVIEPQPVESPPSGPFIKDPLNPIVPIGVPDGRTSLLAENIVYDDVTGHYWMALTDQTIGTTLALAWSDDPTNPAAWYWGGYVDVGSAIAPHLIKHGDTWYIFYGDRAHGTPYPVAVASSPNIAGPYTYIGPVLPAGAPGTWEDARADEPYVFQRADGKWIMMYMGDAGGNVEQVGYAEADNILGPYTKFAGNPCIPFGPSGSYDAGTVADPWVYLYNGVYCIGYTVSPTTSSPWQTALATTTDWQTFTKQGLILESGSEYNSFRGAVTRIGDEYVFSYTGGPSSGAYRLCIATQPVYITGVNPVNDADAVFDFYDGFDSGTDPDISKWAFMSGNPDTHTSIEGGLLTLTATGTTAGSYVRIDGTVSVGVGYVSETRGRHPDQGTNNMIMEAGFATSGFVNTIRIVDDFPSVTNWQRHTAAASVSDGVLNMARTADQDWHLFKIYRNSDGSAGFQVDDTPTETVTANVPVVSMPQFLMSFGSSNDFIVDWTRIRKWAGSDPVATVGSEEHHTTVWTGMISNDWNDPDNWTVGLPGTGSVISVPGGTDPTLFDGALTIGPLSEMYLEPGGAATITGDLTNSGLLTIGSTLASSGSLIVNGSTAGNIMYNRQLKPGSDATSDWHLAAPPVATNSDANTGKVNAVFEWYETDGSWNTTAITSALPGHGYNIRQEDGSDGVISFTGPIVNSDLTVAASSPYADAIAQDESYFDRTYVAGRSLEDLGGRGWNLLGNPYPSAISATSFIGANYSSTPELSQFDPNYVALYLFDGTARRYYYIANSTGWPSGVALSETHVQAGQGFFVLAMNDNSEFTFTRAMQEHSTAAAMLKSGETDDRWPGLQLKVAHPDGEVITTVVYSQEMISGVDPGYDVGLFKSGQSVELYTILPAGDNGINYTRQALPLSVADTIIVPVGVDTEDGGEVVFSAVTVPAGSNKFWFEDRTAGTFTDLSSATYTVTLPAKSYGTGRFFIIASTNTPTGVNLPEVEAGLRIWSSFGKIIIKGPVTSGSVCELFDMQGNRILGKRLDDGELNTVSLPAGMGGVCLVRVTDGVKVTSKKVVVL